MEWAPLVVRALLCRGVRCVYAALSVRGNWLSPDTAHHASAHLRPRSSLDSLTSERRRAVVHERAAERNLGHKAIGCAIHFAVLPCYRNADWWKQTGEGGACQNRCTGGKPALFFLHEHCSNISVDSARNRYEESEHPGHQDREMMKLHRPKMDRSQQAPGVRVHHYALGSVQYGAGGAARCKNHQARHPAAQDLTSNIATRDLRGAAERSPTVLSPPPAFPD